MRVDQALAEVLARCAPLPAEPAALETLSGRVLAADVLAPCDLPGFDNAAMDGYALALGDRSAHAGEAFEVAGEQAAGDPARASATACAIMTGARLPEGLDTVVPVEETRSQDPGTDDGPARIALTAAARPGQHVRRAGEDIVRGAPALPAGTRIGPAQLMLLAALGVEAAPVRRRPAVAVLCTGRELVDDPRQPLASGEIRNSNGPFLRAALATAGARVLPGPASVPDDPAAFRTALAQALADGADLVVSTGAVSMGRYDFIPEVLAVLPAQTVFHRLRMRPGKPLLFALLPGGALFFGLPGNPVSSAVGLRFFVLPALHALLGLPAERALQARLSQDARKKPGLTLFQKARVFQQPDGTLAVDLLPGQESFRIAPLARANAWAVLPEDGESLAAGTPVAVYPLSPADAWPDPSPPDTRP
ncbi:MAG: molybdopterin molybdotransferase MoeA [Xanthomonadales bacterium]|nr:molybdopterin molybdotransferase MoeA [Xanthomonadales bacterium]